jgi:two-component system NarL family response regulator
MGDQGAPAAEGGRGARGYLLKGMEAEELIAAIRYVQAGQSSVCPLVAQQLAHRLSTLELTRREQEVLETIAAGKSNREIASSLDVSEETVKTHLNSLFSKLDVADRTQAAITAVQRGLVHLDFMADKLTFSRTGK